MRVALLVTAIGAILGLNMVVLKLAIRSSDPLTVQALSTVIGAVAMLGIAAAAGDPVFPGRRGLPAAAAVGLAMTVASSLGVAYGVERVDAGLAALVMSTTPIVTMALGWLLSRERHSWPGLLGVGLGVAGVGIVALGAGGPGKDGHLAGVLFMLLGAVGWSLGLVLMKTMGGGVAATTLICWQMICGVPLMLVAGWVSTGLAAVWSVAFVLALVYAGVMAKAVSFLLQLVTIRLSSSVHASLTAFLMPIFGTAAGVLLLKETVDGSEALGAVVIFVGVAFVLASRTASPAPTKPLLASG